MDSVEIMSEFVAIKDAWIGQTEVLVSFPDKNWCNAFYVFGCRWEEPNARRIFGRGNWLVLE